MSIVELFYLLIFPGFLFTAILGLSAGWVDRKVSARFQYRVGPPLLQNFNDFFKLLGKESIIIRDGIQSMFILAPLIAFAMLVVVSSIIGAALFFNYTFLGDLIVVLYLLMIFSIMVIFGGASTGNVYSSFGAGREIKLLIADELAFIIAVLIPVIKSGYNIQFQGIVETQQQAGAFIGSVSGVMGFVIALLCVQAKMTLPPFHIPEAETEIVEGPFIEYSGPLLAFWKLDQFMMYVLFPFLLILLFLGGFSIEGWGILWFILKYILILVLMIVIKNTNPRIRIDTALNFFWKYAAGLAFAGAVLAVFDL